MNNKIIMWLFLLAWIAACVPQQATPAEATLPATAEYSPLSTQTENTEIEDTPAEATLPATAEYYPLDTQTGNAEIDDVLAAVASGDRLEVIKRFGYLSTECATVNALGGPPACRTGEADGTLVEVFPMLSGEGSYIYADTADTFPGLKVNGVHSVFQNSANAYSEKNFPAGKYTILLVSDEMYSGIALRIDAGKIVRIDYLFDSSSFDTILQRDAAQFILSPLK